MRTVTLTCHTPGCGNAAAPIPLDVDPDVSAFACGVCGQPITDTREASPS